MEYVTVNEIDKERFVNIVTQKSKIEELHHLLHNGIQHNRNQNRQSPPKGELPNIHKMLFCASHTR